MAENIGRDPRMRGDLPPHELSPSVSYVVGILEGRIRSGLYVSGQWLPAERSIVEEFRLSRPIIRSAVDELERRGLVRRAARHRPVVWCELQTVEGAGMSHGANRTSVATKPQGRRSIALWITGDVGDYGPNSVIRSVYRSLPIDRYRLALACPTGSTLEEAIRSETQALQRFADDEDCAGVILWHLGGLENIAPLRKLRANDKPIVFIDRKPPVGFEADYVGVNNRRGAEEAVRCLLALGHREIAIITSPDDASSVKEREEGYTTALGDAEISFVPEWIVRGEFLMPPMSTDESVVAAYWTNRVEEFLRIPSPRPTAAFAVNDYSATRFIKALRANGLKVPEDVAIIGFDNSARWTAAEPQLSSVSQPFDELGEEAVRLLLERLAKPATFSYRHVLLPATLVLRGSSGNALA